MDDRVYDVLVCSACLAQVHEAEACPACGATDSKNVRVRAPRGAILEIVQPRRHLIEKTVYFGCVREAGHYYWFRGRDGHPYRPGREVTRQNATPWGYSIDGGLFPRGQGPTVEGEAHVFHLHGWTALAFLDRSVDHRGGSWSVYCIPDVVDGPEALAIAREAYPPIFARYGFEVRLAE